MSGICGILRFDDAPASRKDVERQISAMRHLAPDRRESWCSGAIGLGHLLMRITGEDFFDVQPLHNANGTTLVADVRLDNRIELAGAFGIEEAALRDLPDSALILRAYEQWGSHCAEHLIGDFAFAIWDERAGKLVLARDHVGQRRIVFHRSRRFFAFATEFKGLWALGDIPRALADPVAASRIPTDRPEGVCVSPFESIEALCGSTVLTIARDGTLATRRYWEPRADPAHIDRDDAYYVDAYRRVLGEAVACRLRRTTRPGGLLFGGGFDSGAIAALAGPVMRAQGRRLIAASSVMPAGYKGTIRHARRWAERCVRDMPHLQMHYVTREGRDVFTDMETSFLQTDLGHSPNRYVTDALYETIAAADARVVMDGHGGDYTLNIRGFPWLFALLRKGDIRGFAAEFGAYRRHSGDTAFGILRREVLRYLVPPAIRRARERRKGGLRMFGHTRPLIKQYGILAQRPAGERPTTAKTMRQHLVGTLNRLRNGRSLSGSIAAAAHGLEFTQPFHDKRVIELALAIPPRLWVKGGRERYLARVALENLLPREYQARRRGNDDLVPDFLSMSKSIEPKVLAEIDRMERDGRLSHRFDFPRMRAMLTRRGIDDHNSGSEYDTRQAMLTFLAARFIEWFRRDNA
jgi:asparagine synthase (glutamine-hydrolysing)